MLPTGGIHGGHCVDVPVLEVTVVVPSLIFHIAIPPSPIAPIANTAQTGFVAQANTPAESIKTPPTPPNPIAPAVPTYPASPSSRSPDSVPNCEPVWAFRAFRDRRTNIRFTYSSPAAWLSSVYPVYPAGAGGSDAFPGAPRSRASQADGHRTWPRDGRALFRSIPQHGPPLVGCPALTPIRHGDHCSAPLC